MQSPRPGTNHRRGFLCARCGWGPRVRVCPFPSASSWVVREQRKGCQPWAGSPSTSRAQSSLRPWIQMSLFLGRLFRRCRMSSNSPALCSSSVASPVGGPWSEAREPLFKRPSLRAPPFSPDLGHDDLNACLVTGACSGPASCPAWDSETKGYCWTTPGPPLQHLASHYWARTSLQVLSLRW